MKKTFSVAEILNIISFYQHINADENKAKEIGTKIRWALKKAISTMTDDAKNFEEFRTNEIDKIRNEFFTDEKSKEVVTPKLNKDGEPELDDEGNQLTETVREVNPEFKDDYDKAIKELNDSLTEIASEEHEYEYKGVNMDDFVDSLSNNTSLTFEELSVLDAVLGE